MIANNQDLRWARRIWKVPASALRVLDRILEEYDFSVLLGDISFLRGKWYVTHVGLLRLAHRRGCQGIEVELVSSYCDVATRNWVFRATVHSSAKDTQFVGFGDANPSNVSPSVLGAEMRVAETRAVNRALRKAYGIGICSVEEIGSSSGPVQTGREINSEVRRLPSSNGHGSSGNGTRVRDRLCQIIRQHQLDPVLVKAYAIDFCGTKTLRDAKREQVESFVIHISAWAQKDRNALLCQLNSYLRPQEGAA